MLLSLLVALWSLHPIHVSVTEIEHNEKNRSLEIISRIFIDDLELSVRRQTGNETLDLLNPGNGLTTDQLVKDYLKEHLQISVDGKPARINYLAHELDDAAIVCYLEIEGVKKLKKVDVMNSVIQETHADQSNLVHVTYLSVIRSLRLTRERPSGSLEFDKPNP
ncbi:MAG: hypothetical protein JNN04_06630 [Cyclobacteriaceae bacterium]|nr:hypothetical protein [Cyclobacteriaceae bacterium]